MGGLVDGRRRDGQILRWAEAGGPRDRRGPGRPGTPVHRDPRRTDPPPHAPLTAEGPKNAHPSRPRRPRRHEPADQPEQQVVRLPHGFGREAGEGDGRDGGEPLQIRRGVRPSGRRLRLAVPDAQASVPLAVR